MTLRPAEMALRHSTGFRGCHKNGHVVVTLTFAGEASVGSLRFKAVGDETAAERAFSYAEATGRPTWIDTPGDTRTVFSRPRPKWMIALEEDA